jgi:galactokinase
VSDLVRAPGRVNLIGDHTDYTGGLVFPMAIDRWTEIAYEAGGNRVELTSADEPDAASFELPVVGDPVAVAPGWGRYVAAVAAELGATTGIRGSVSTTIPVGAGLSSSAALEVAAALALGHEGTALDLARLGQRAEHRATGVPTGIMDQLCIASAVEGHALLIDCSTFEVVPSPVPDDVVIVVRFVAKRTLRIAAQYADGWNAPFVAPEQFAAKRAVLHRHCADVGRDPTDIRCAVNLGLAWTEESLRGQFGGLADFVRPGVLTGSVAEVVERVGEYVAAGVDQVNLALRAPFDVDALEQFAAAFELA